MGYLEKLAQQPVMPRQNGFHFETTRNTLDLNCQSLTDDKTYLGAVANGLKIHKHLKILNLRRTDIDTNGALLLFRSLNKVLEHLDISENP